MEEEKKPKEAQDQIKSAGKGAENAYNTGKDAVGAGKSLVNAGKNTVDAIKKAPEMAKKAAKTAGKVAKATGKAIMTVVTNLFNPVFWMIILISTLVVIILVGLVYITNEFSADKIIAKWTEMFPMTISGDSKNATSDGTVIEAAKSVHQIIEQQRYTYGSNSSQTVEESEATGRKTVDCSTYVDWVLARIGLKLPSRYCDNALKSALDAETWCDNIGTNRLDAQPGDLVLFSGHIQIYGGNPGAGEDLWYNARQYKCNSSPSS